ncbi:hypothetical protein ZOSMA_9G01550 [Zostera marina]|uniref:HIT-type domain-containing protein n=1 Tax=Zostera marina TaxID=29655 RepID=A0A0K9NH07_ZOSMR|nr:hypothetical protein ZOSMA_9G01550 [Zostera marina]
MVASTKKCEVCGIMQSKYKCPSCLLPYCSLTCFKKHKEIPCQKPFPPEENSAFLVVPKRLLHVNDRAWILQTEDFRSIAESTEIRDALKDKQLQKLIQAVVLSKDPEDDIDKLSKEDGFREFTDKVLSIINAKNLGEEAC